MNVRFASYILLTLAVFSLAPQRGIAQTPSATRNVGERADEFQPEGVAANNPWIGAQIGYKFGGTKEFSDNLLVSARVLYFIDLGDSPVKMPVMGNIAPLSSGPSSPASADEEFDHKIQELVNSAQGLHVGLYPYYEAVNVQTLRLTVHSVAAWKLNALSDTSGEVQQLNQGRFSLGAELMLGKRSGEKRALSLSVAPVVTVFDKATYGAIFGEERSTLWSLEITGVLPVSKQIGFLFEAIVAEEGQSAFRTGLLFATETS